MACNFKLGIFLGFVWENVSKFTKRNFQYLIERHFFCISYSMLKRCRLINIKVLVSFLAFIFAQLLVSGKQADVTNPFKWPMI